MLKLWGPLWNGIFCFIAKYLANKYMHKVNNRNSKKRVKYVIFKVKNKDNDVVLLPLLLTLNMFHIFFYVAHFEQVNVWKMVWKKNWT